MKSKRLFEEIILKAEFFDVDSMKIVWHGNYIKYYEQARCALMDRIGYNYTDMENSGYAWPIVGVDVKYMKPLVFGQEFRIRATLMEYENRIRISYKIHDLETGVLLNKGTTTQMAVSMETGESLFVSPDVLLNSVEALLEGDLTSEGEEARDEEAALSTTLS
jgi:acyl-CoA thioester hydrolase